jgi:hypothetical protein
LGWIIVAGATGFALGGGPCFNFGGALGAGGARGLEACGGALGIAGLTILTGTAGPSLTRAEMAAESEITAATIATWSAEEPTK